MSQVRIIDVTLRDGGYRNNFEFTTDYAINAVAHLAEVGVHCAEIGYCNGSFIRKPEHGANSAVTGDYINALVKAAQGRLGLCVMVHPRNVTAVDLAQLAERGVAMVRVCLRLDQLDEGLRTLALAKSFGVEVSANITHVTTQPAAVLADMALRAEGTGVDVICFADSNGHMLPDDVRRLFDRTAREVHTPLGFHAHNNLSLALANAMAAIDAGAEYIDASLCGMGKGAGNLPLGMLIGYLHRCDHRDRHDLVKALQLSEYTAQQVSASNLPAPLVDVMLGAYNLPFDVQARLDEVMSRLQLASTYHGLRALHEQNLTARHAQGARP
ncbi:nucleoid-structuring protein H-NS [Pseudomonas sp. MWU16-30317]|uniref:nucleoid-structuring protein H-NS n=1 Tax=Pseudomonas sp. MWU16-30317 TaxID=2878095 RepID=UPI001CFA8049|nr:nucleoid-structuring protein H-NS [Pseudomonas sp. MWU16-30317]